MAGMLAAAFALAPVLVCASELSDADEDAGVTAEAVDEPEEALPEQEVTAVRISEEDVSPLRADTTAFAVYCSTDGSLTFYADTGVPSEGGTYKNKKVTEVYTGFETLEPTAESALPWHKNDDEDGDIRDSVLSVKIDSSFAGVQPVSTRWWFDGFVNCKSADLTYLDTSKVTDMSYMFRNCSSITTLDVSGWDTGKVTEMGGMFESCTGLTGLDTSGWDTKNVTYMGRMFYKCTALATLDVSGWDTSNVTNMTVMFQECESLTEIDVSGWKTDKVTNMYCMFWRCRKVTSFDFTNWNTKNVTLFSNFIVTCESLEYVDIGSGFDLFARSDKGDNISVSPQYWYDSPADGHVVSDNFMIGVTEPGRYYTYSKSVFAMYSAQDGSMTFYTDTAVPYAGDNYDGKTATFVYTGIKDTGSGRPEWNGIAGLVSTVYTDESFAEVTPVSTAYWFCDFSNCSEIDLEYLDTSCVTNMSYMFNDCLSLTYLDISGFDTAAVTVWSNFAIGCSSLEWIKTGSGFDLFTKSSSKLVTQKNWYDSNSYGTHVSVNYMIGTDKAGTYWTYSKYGFSLKSVDGNGNALSGTEFTMTDADGELCWFTCEGSTYTLCPADTKNAVSAISVTSDGVRIEGVTDEDYTLTETKAAAGYALIDPVVVTVGDKGLSVDGSEAHAAVTGTWSMQVIQGSTVVTMPNTGGIGTMRILLIGLAAALCGLAGALRERKGDR